MRLEVLLFILILFVSCNGKETKTDNQQLQKVKQNPSPQLQQLIPKIINKYPHDKNAYTQGLVYHNGYLYESTGLYGKSSLRKVEITTGKVLQSILLSPQYFGEGIAILDNKIYQLTWENKKVFVYDLKTFKLLNEYTFPTEGWGITTDGKQLIVSDGSNFLTYYKPENFSITNTLMIKQGNKSLYNINEMEYHDGMIYANVYMTDSIVIINPNNGDIIGWIDISSLRQKLDDPNSAEVSNGIAYNYDTKTFYLTGKNWSNLFEVVFVER
jgi:Glutamine cyclotransferase